MGAVLRDAYVRPHPRATDGPLVTVVIAAYNRATVLRHALASVLRQDYRHIEVLVVGDACTDESEEVARAAGDERVRWFNLEENTGSQAGPNQAALELARGELIAYLGQDDLWRPDHLAVLVADLERRGADATTSTVSIVYPGRVPVRRLLSPAAGSFNPTSTLMHTRAAGLAAGGWRPDYRNSILPPDEDFYARLRESGARFSRVRALTVIKFTSVLRPGSYRDRSDREQACARARLYSRGCVAREVAAAAGLAPLRPWFGRGPRLPADARERPGALMAEFRRIRGLEP